MAKERKSARKFAEMALERQLVRDQYIVPEEPVNWNVTRVHDDWRRVMQGAESPADRTRAVAHARVIRHANVREDSAAVFNEAEENERKAMRRMAQRCALSWTRMVETGLKTTNPRCVLCKCVQGGGHAASCCCG